MKVLLTGATGFVGREVLGELTRSGHTVRVLARNAASARKRIGEWGFTADFCEGDVLNRESLPLSCGGMDAVIHLVGIISEVREQSFERVHTGGTQNVLEAAQQAGVRRLIQMSALGARADSAARYHRSKAAAEELVRQSGLDYTIFRPSIIYGPRDHFVNLFANMSRWSPVLLIMDSGRCKLQPVPVEQVATSFVGALSERRAIGQTYALCGPDALTFEQILDAILAVTGRRRLKLHVPSAVAQLQAASLEFFFGRLLGKPAPLNRDQLLMLEQDNVTDPTPASELFGFKPMPFREGIARYLKSKD